MVGGVGVGAMTRRVLAMGIWLGLVAGCGLGADEGSGAAEAAPAPAPPAGPVAVVDAAAPTKRSTPSVGAAEVSREAVVDDAPSAADAPVPPAAEAFLREVVAGMARGCEPPETLGVLELAYGASVTPLPPGYDRFERRLADPHGGSRLVAGLGAATLDVVEAERFAILAVPVLDARVHGLRVRELRWMRGVDNGISAVELRFDATPAEAASRLVDAGVRLQPGEFAAPTLGAPRDGGGAALGCDFSM